MIRLLFFILLNSCTVIYGTAPRFYEKNDIIVDKNELIKNNDGIVIMNKSSMCSFRTLDNIVESKEYCFLNGFISSAPLVAIKFKAGRYIWLSGLVHKGITSCSIPFDDSIRCDGYPTIDNQPAIIYFDLKPGEVNYIGKIQANENHRDTIVDNFSDDKIELLKTMPNIANAMQKKLMVKVKRPAECDFLADLIINNTHKKLPRSNAKLDPRYPACIKTLQNLSTDNEINNKGENTRK